LESCQFFGSFLVVCLACLAGFFARLLPRLTFLPCCALQAGSVGRLSGRLFPSVDGFPYLELFRHREFPRHPFGSLTLNPCTLIGSACLPGSLGLLSGLPITFDLLWGIRPATCSGFPELLHLPEFLGSLLRPHDLAYLRQPFARSVCPLQLVRPDQLQLLRCQAPPDLDSASRCLSTDFDVLKLALRIVGQVPHLLAYFVGNFFTGHRFPPRAENLTGL
jgi:hypothetical protein